MHLPRPPAIDHGVVAGIWAVFLALMIWLFMLGIGMQQATSFLVSVVAGCAIFLYVRNHGEDEPRRKRPS